MHKCCECGRELVADVETMPENQLVGVYTDGGKIFYCVRCYCKRRDAERVGDINAK